MNKLQKFGLIIGLIGFLYFNIFSFFPDNLPASNLLAIVFLIVSFWIFEVIPLSVTSLLPFILFPIFGIMKADNVASYYFNSTIFLFLGGFLLASAIENWQLHKRISLIITDKIGKTPDMLIFG
ncbi:MAG: SLC13 family permease, partial [Candidatus Kapaibacteriota bacterium]